MKKIAVILVICFITALFVSACNEKSCPAYTQAETLQAENNG
jgi:ABC-type Fe3+-citrate transport system substrate-binding protein